MPDYLDLSEFKSGLRRDATFEDALLLDLLDAAEGYLGDPENGILGRPVVRTEFTEKFSGFGDVKISHPDGAIISAVNWTDADGATLPVGGIFELCGENLKLKHGEAWPSPVASVEVTYSAGFDVIPEQIKRAGYFYAASLERGRHSDTFSPEKVSRAVSLMVSGYRRVGL